MTLYDDAQSLREQLIKVGSTEAHDAAEKLIAGVEALYNDTPAQRIGKLVRDENGLPMTGAAIAVLVSTLLTFDQVDEDWGEKNLPGAPSVTDYSIHVIQSLRERYCKSVIV